MYVNEENLYFDNIILPRSENSFSVDHNLLVLRDQIPALKSLAQCVLMNWMPILVSKILCYDLKISNSIQYNMVICT